MSVTLYGIPNCDTIKKARAWLTEQGVSYTFHDYKKRGADPARIERWVDSVGWEAVLNRRGTTFRGLPEEDRTNLNAASAVALMGAHPSCIKRPIIEHPDGLLVGFDAEAWAQALR